MGNEKVGNGGKCISNPKLKSKLKVGNGGKWGRDGSVNPKEGGKFIGSEKEGRGGREIPKSKSKVGNGGRCGSDGNVNPNDGGIFIGKDGNGVLVE